MKLVSVNIGGVTQIEIGGGTVGTGIYKVPVSGPVIAGHRNLDGDRIVDLRVHGGEHKAVYAYPVEHYEVWADELGCDRGDLRPGQFGENFTIEGLLEEDAHIGDRFRIGQALMEVTQPRVPCYKLALRMNDPEFPKKLIASKRSGFYLRVIEEGEVVKDNDIKLEEPGPEQISIKDLYTLRFEDPSDKDTIKRAIGIPALSEEWRKELTTLV